MSIPGRRSEHSSESGARRCAAFAIFRIISAVPSGLLRADGSVPLRSISRRSLRRGCTANSRRQVEDGEGVSKGRWRAQRVQGGGG